MTYDLRLESWIPWRRRSGAIEWGPPALLVDRIDDDPVIALAAPRPDFDGALQEFLIGLLTAALQPEDEREWKKWYLHPPPREEVQSALDALPPAFDLDGDGPRFFQDFAMVDFSHEKPRPVEQLLIDAPGEKGVDLNTDLFVKRQFAKRLGRPAAAMALLTLQTYAPSGGRGNRTSLRGGGPLTTLVDPRVDEGECRAHEQPLWHKLWANVEIMSQFQNRTPPGAPSTVDAAFPWLAATRTSEKTSGKATTASDAHPLQAYFGLPRRIRLEFDGAGRCDLVGSDDTRTVTGFLMLQYGVEYKAWRHPLSPYYLQKANRVWLPVHPQLGGLGWRDWVGLTFDEPQGGMREPAAVVAAFKRRWSHELTYRLDAFGYDMEKMKARGWIHAEFPLYVVNDEQREALLRNTAISLSDAVGIASTALLGAIKAALFQSPDNAPGDLSAARTQLWSATENAFFDTMAAVASPSIAIDEAVEASFARKGSFVHALRERALGIFDRWCPASSLPPALLRRRVTARYDLTRALNGYSKLGEKLFGALGIPLPGGWRTALASKKRSRKEAGK